MSGQVFRRLSALVIVIGTQGCDNVEWGGVEIRLRPPPPARVGAREDTVEVGSREADIRLPRGPVLYMGERDPEGVSLVPVGEILDDSVAPFPSEDSLPGYRARFARELMAPGAEFVLFAEGVRVGRLTAGDLTTDETFCTPRPAVRGVAELVPAAVDRERFLALPLEAAGGRHWRAYATPAPDRAQANASLNLAARVIPQVGARWPGELVDIRWDLQALSLEDGTSAFAVTYLFRDRMAVQPAGAGSYSLFLLGVPDDGTWSAGYVWYRPAAREGKGAARFFEHLDWDDDGREEVLLEVLGETHRWAAALDRRGVRWDRVYEAPCGTAAPPVQP